MLFLLIFGRLIFAIQIFFVPLQRNIMRKLLQIGLLLLGLCMAQAGFVMAADAPQQKAFTVVIDAGHGGKDPGAVGKNLYEKDVNLAVALLAGKMIQDAYPEVKVLYTRDKDVFITLQGRADFVNKNNADLFLCIHANSSDQAAACGAETFVLGTEKMEQNLDVAMRENSVIKLESDYQTAYQGFDPNSIDSYIMFELMQNQYMDQSLRFATLVQQEFVGKLHRYDRGVRQAAFWVLLKSACPSVLIELGFVSNPEEARYMASEDGRQQLAQSIYNAFQGFYRKAPRVEPPQAVSEPAEKKPAKPEPKPAKPETPKKPETPAKPAKPETPVKPAPAPQPEAKPESAPAPKPTPEPAPQPAPAPQPEAQQSTIYAVQVLASRKPIPQGDPVFRGYNCQFIHRGEWYKYYFGATTHREEAVRWQQEIKEKFPGCFIITL